MEADLGAFTGGTIEVQGVGSGGMRIAFKDPRKYLVGRTDVLEHMATALTSSAWRRDVVCGESGAGKTVLCIGVAHAVQHELPMQLFMEVKSHMMYVRA